MAISLHEMKAGDTGRVVGFKKSFTAYRQKLLAMDLTPVTEFQVMHIAPLGEQVDMRVRDTGLGVRQKEVVLVPMLQRGNQRFCYWCLNGCFFCC